MLAIELPAQALERAAGLGRGDLAVDIHGHGDLAVPQDLHCHSWVDVQSDQKRGTGTAGVVDPDISDLCLVAASRLGPAGR